MIDPSFRHFVLYAKHWYVETDVISDLMKIQSNYSGIDEKYLSVSNIIWLLIEMVSPLVRNSNYSFHSFISSLCPSECWKVCLDTNEAYNFQKVLIYNCLSVLRLARVSDIGFDLGKPDEKILPLKNPSQKD